MGCSAGGDVLCIDAATHARLSTPSTNSKLHWLVKLNHPMPSPHLPTTRPGASGPALSGEGPAMSDARARADGAVEQPIPPAAQGQLFSPARQPMDADDASSRWPQQPGAAQQAQQAQQAAAPAAAPKFKLKLAGGPAQPEAATAAAAPAAGPAAAPAASSLLALAQRVQQQTQQAHVPNASGAPVCRRVL